MAVKCIINKQMIDCKINIYNNQLVYIIEIHPKIGPHIPFVSILQMSKQVKYDIQAMTQAVNAVRQGHIKIAVAAREFGIPRKTLDDRIKGLRPVDAKMGGRPVLSPTEEEALVDYFDYMSLHGFRSPGIFICYFPEGTEYIHTS